MIRCPKLLVGPDFDVVDREFNDISLIFQESMNTISDRVPQMEVDRPVVGSDHAFAGRSTNDGTHKSCSPTIAYAGDDAAERFALILWRGFELEQPYHSCCDTERSDRIPNEAFHHSGI
jgi:hypothetical protein